MGPTLLEFKEGDTWDPKLAEGLEEKQRRHTWILQYTRKPAPAKANTREKDISESADSSEPEQPKSRKTSKSEILNPERGGSVPNRVESEESEELEVILDGDPVDETPG